MVCQAGYIDIKWNNPIGGTVKPKHNLCRWYMLIQLHQRVNITQTSVAYHTAWIEAELSNGARKRNIPRQ